MEPFTVITPTGERPEPFSICQKLMQKQSVQPYEWIIVDDGFPPTKIPEQTNVKYVHRENTFPVGRHTLPVQMIAALKYVTTDRIIIVEDDDWYCPDYFERMSKLFDEHANTLLIGQGESIYYHIPFSTYYEVGNKDRASWCQTAFRSAFSTFVLEECKNQRDPFLDMRLWTKTSSKFLLLHTTPMCVGIKGLPGRTSPQTMGHKGISRHFKPDPDHSKLRSLIGDDMSLYEKYHLKRSA